MLIKQASDLNSSTINQMVMHRLAETVYDGQVAAARAHYRRRRDAMLAALRAPHAGGRELDAAQRRPVRVAAPARGHAMRRACSTAPSTRRGVAFVPGAAFFFDGRGRNTLRLSYSLASEAEIEDGIARLAKLI